MKGIKEKRKGPGTPAPVHAVDGHDLERAEYLEACRVCFEIGTAPDNPRKQQAADGRAWAFEALMHVLEEGVPVPAWLASATLDSWRRFQRFEAHSLGEAFGVADQAHTAARRGDLRCGAIAFEVEQLRAAGLPLKDNANTRGALSAAGAVFNMSAKSVEARVRLWRTLQSNGAKPGATPANGIAYYKALQIRIDHSYRTGRAVLRSDVAAACDQALNTIRDAMSGLLDSMPPKVAATSDSQTIRDTISRGVLDAMRQIKARMTGPEMDGTPAQKLLAQVWREQFADVDVMKTPIVARPAIGAKKR